MHRHLATSNDAVDGVIEVVNLLKQRGVWRADTPTSLEVCVLAHLRDRLTADHLLAPGVGLLCTLAARLALSLDRLPAAQQVGAWQTAALAVREVLTGKPTTSI
jgi:hypothetical protein